MRAVLVSIGLLLVVTWIAVGLAHDGHDHGTPTLEGSWIAERAERDGKPATDVIGHRLTLTRERFEIASQDGERLFSGTIEVDTRATPARIDFVHAAGVPGGSTWKGIYALGSDTLTICDNAPNVEAPRPVRFAAPAGSGYVLINFVRTSVAP
jgi:uncharacterized protein (TIGR03067 family)